MGNGATIIDGDIFDDFPIKEEALDEFVHGALADVVTGLLIEADPPLNVAVFSPWGSGKSSFFTLLKARLRARAPSYLLVSYDAWKFGGKALKRHFILDVAEQLGLNEDDGLTTILNHSTESSRLRYLRWIRLNWASLLGALAFSAATGFGWASLHAWILADWLTKKLDWKEAFTQVLPEVGYVMALVLAAVVFGPKAMEAAVTKTSKPAADTDEHFSTAFNELVREALNQHRFRRKKNAKRLIIYIDELDRCEAADVVETLTDLKTFLHHPDVIFVVAADRDALVEALREHGQATPVRVDAPYYSTPGAFIDKVFQHQVTLPPFRPTALSSFATREAQKKTTGIWAELKDPALGGNERLFRETIYCLIPAHVRSPRRVKVLLNNFATTARMAQSRDIVWHPRAKEVAVLAVLNTEFPDVAAAMLRVPQLLKHIRTGEAALEGLPRDQRAVVARFLPPVDEQPEESPENPPSSSEVVPESAAGPAGAFLRTSDESNDRHLEQLGQGRLNQQLQAYLRKLDVVGETGVSDPRRDLLYLRAIGIDDGLTSATLSDVVDTAADVNPLDVINAFNNENAPTSERLIAIALLSRQAQDEEAVQKANLLEAACLLIEALPTRDDVTALRPDVAPEIFASLSSDQWGHETTPGAIALATAIGNDAVAIQLFRQLRPTSPNHDQITQRGTRFLDWATTQVITAVAQQLATASEINPNPVLDVIRHNHPAVALTVWSRAQNRMMARITALEADESAPTTGVAAPTPADEPDDPTSDVADLLHDLLDAALHPAYASDEDSNTTADPALLSSVLEFVQHVGDPGVTQWTFDNSEELLAPLKGNPILARTHIALGIHNGTPEQWPDWLPEWHNATDEAPGSTSETLIVRWASSALQTVIEAIPTLGGETLDGAIATANALLPNSEPEDWSNTLRTIAEALGNTDWADDTDTKRRSALRALARNLVTPPDTTDVAEALVTDLIAGTLATAAPNGVYSAVAPFLDELSEASSAEFAQHLTDEYQSTPAAAQPDVLRLRIHAGANGDQPPLTFADLETTLATELPPVLASWLATNPDPAEVALSLESTTYASAAPLRAYAVNLDSEQRATLWIAARKATTATSVCKAIGEPGVGSEAVIYTAELIAGEPQQDLRTRQVNALVDTTTLDEATPHSEATKLALQLFELDNKGDKQSALRVIAHSGGVADGNKVRLAKLVKKFLNTSNHGVPIKTSATLYRLELANKPKAATDAAKSLLNRILSGGAN